MKTNLKFEPDVQQLASLRKWRASTFAVMLFGYIGYYLIRGNLPVALPLLSDQFGYNHLQLGIILSFSELAYALGKFTTGPLADRLGGKKIFLAGMLGGIFFNFVFAFGSTLTFFTVTWCAVRYFLSMGWGGIVKTIGEWFEPERNGTVMGLISVNFQFGGVLASLFSGFLVSLGVGWRGLFICPAMVVVGVAVISYFAAKDSPRTLFPDVRFGKNAGEKTALIDSLPTTEEKPAAHEIIGRLFKVKVFPQVLVFSFLTTVLRSFFMFWIPKFMVDMGMGNVNAALSSAVFPLVGCVGTIALGWYTDRAALKANRASALWKMLLGLVITLIWIAILIAQHGDYNLQIVVLLGFAGLFLYGPYSMAAGCMSLDIAGTDSAGTATGLVDGFGYLGGSLAAWGTGLIADRWGWSEVFWSLALLSLVTVIWAYYMSWFFERQRTESISGSLCAEDDEMNSH